MYNRWRSPYSIRNDCSSWMTKTTFFLQIKVSVVRDTAIHDILAKLLPKAFLSLSTKLCLTTFRRICWGGEVIILHTIIIIHRLDVIVRFSVPFLPRSQLLRCPSGKYPRLRRREEQSTASLTFLLL